uniref:Annexin n=1 Tax=Acrobeloides nanus TaxID=290746 RepID=A0A914DVH5_9BILA
MDGRQPNFGFNADPNAGYPQYGSNIGPGYPQQGPGGQGYPQQGPGGPGYPPQPASNFPNQAPYGQGYGGSGYPPPGGPSYPQSTNPGYPPQASNYPPQSGSSYPPQAPNYPPQSASGYPPQGPNPGYPSQPAGYPPQPAQGYPSEPRQPTYPGQGYQNDPRPPYVPYSAAPAMPSYPAQPSQPSQPFPPQQQGYGNQGYPQQQGYGQVGQQQGGQRFPPYDGRQNVTPQFQGANQGSGAGYQQSGQNPTMNASPSLRPTPTFDANSDANDLRKAMKGFGTNNQKVIRVVCGRTNRERQEIAKTYRVMYGKDLIADLKSELSGDFEELILALMEPSAVYDAKQLRKAMVGLGTKESVLIEIMCSRTNAQIQEIKTAYKHIYGRELERELIGDSSGHFQRLLISLCVGGRDESNWTDPAKASQV